MNFSIRNSIYIDVKNIEEIYDLALSDVPNLILTYTEGEARYSTDVGSWCYEVKGKRDSVNKVMPVDLDTLNLSRVKAVKEFVLESIESINSRATLRDRFKICQTVIGFLDKNYQGVNIQDFNFAKEIYQNFSIELIGRKNLLQSNTDISNFDGLSKKQKVMREFLSKATNVSVEIFASSIRRLKLDKNIRPVRLTDENEIKVFQAIQLKIFHDISSSLMKSNKLPILIDLVELGGNKYFFDFNFIPRESLVTHDEFYDENCEIRSQDEISEKLMASGKIPNDITISQFKKLYSRKRRSLEARCDLDFKDCKVKVRLANVAIIAFCKAFIGATSVNESVVFDLRADGFLNVSATKGMRAYGIKNRANSKSVPIEFGLKFTEYFKSYLAFRSFLLGQYDQDVRLEHGDKLFFVLPNQFGPNQNKITPLNNKAFSSYNDDYKKVFGLKLFTNGELRKNVANSYLNLSNDSLLTANKLGNTPPQINRSYSDVSFGQMAEQLTDYFNEFELSSIRRGRINETKIDVEVSSSETDEGTPIGHCKEKSPMYKEGFVQGSILPDCTKLESCLFCQNYTIHLNEIDLRKILSLRFILNQIPEITAESIQLLFRINELVEYILDHYKIVEGLYKKVLDEVNQGILDSFWSIHLDMLLELGVIS